MYFKDAYRSEKMINNFFELSKASESNHNSYLFNCNKEQLSLIPLLGDIFITALRRVSTMELDENEGLPQIDRQREISTYVRGLDGMNHLVKIIKKLRRFRNQYEIRFDTQYYHIRITFFTVPRVCFKEDIDAISINFMLNKSTLAKNRSERFLDELVQDSTSIRNVLNNENFHNWIEEAQF